MVVPSSEIAAAYESETIECIRSLWHRSRESIVGIGRRLLEAKERLAPGSFLAMIEDKLPFGPKSAQMFMRIAADPRLAVDGQTSNHLPESATALDELRRLPPRTFERAVESGVIHADMTVQDARELKQAAATTADIADEAEGWREIERKLHAPKATHDHAPELPADGVARNYSDLVALLTERRHTLGMNQEALDHIAGWPDRYAHKLERPDSENGKRAVHPSFDWWLGALKVGIKLVPLEGA